MRQRLLRALGLGAVVALAAVSPAAAVTATDPDDTAGKLDVRKVVVTDTASSVTVTVKTWGSWSTDVLASGQNRLAILFDSDLDGAWDYRGRIIKSSGVLVLLLSGRGNSYEPLPVERPSSQAVSFTVPTDAVGTAGADLQVVATSRYRDSGSCATACKDRAPDSGWLLVWDGCSCEAAARARL
ncbi:MAG: hypothetical protein IT201_02890 [Thermoleophilia bacterium]|nr:hypothetical protein [Thermoleophilia bacterium]